MTILCNICKVSIYGDAKIDSFYAPKDIRITSICKECRTRLATLIANNIYVFNFLRSGYYPYAKLRYDSNGKITGWKDTLTQSCMICSSGTIEPYFCDECIKSKIVPKVGMVRKMLALEKL